MGMGFGAAQEPLTQNREHCLLLQTARPQYSLHSAGPCEPQKGMCFHHHPSTAFPAFQTSTALSQQLTDDITVSPTYTPPFSQDLRYIIKAQVQLCRSSRQRPLPMNTRLPISLMYSNLTCSQRTTASPPALPPLLSWQLCSLGSCWNVLLLILLIIGPKVQV